MPRRVFAAVLSALALAACGGSSGPSTNGVEKKSPNQIVSTVSNAVTSVQSVHVAGAVTTSGTRVALDLSLVNGKGGTGSMSQNGLGFKVVTIGNEVYINGSPTFWRKFAGGAAAQLLSGKWLKAPTSGQLGTLAELTDVHKLFTQLLSSHGTLAKGSISTVRGQRVIAVRDTTNGGTLYVATTGKPYPIQIVKPGSQGGQINFDRFNEQVSLTPPANSIDISQLSK